MGGAIFAFCMLAVVGSGEGFVARFGDPAALNPDHVVCRLGDVRVSLSEPISVKLVNGSEEHFIFDDVKKACDCMSVSPAKGEIPPGESMMLSIKLKVPDNPKSLKSGSRFHFKLHGRQLLTLSLEFKIKEYFGFGESVVVVRESEDDPGNFQFTTPVIASEDLASNRVDLELKGPVKSQRLEVYPERGLVAGSFRLMNHAKEDRSSLVLQALDPYSGEKRQVVLLVQRATPIVVLPRLMRFVQSADQATWKCRVYVRNVNSKEIRLLSARSSQFAFQVDPIVTRPGFVIADLVIGTDPTDYESDQGPAESISIVVEEGDETTTFSRQFVFQE